MKLKPFIIPIIIFLVGTGFSIIGVLFKILHWTLGSINGAYLLTIGSIVEVIAIIIIIGMLLRHYLKKDN